MQKYNHIDHLAPVKALPFTDPNVEQATAIGIRKDAGPNTLSPNV